MPSHNHSYNHNLSRPIKVVISPSPVRNGRYVDPNANAPISLTRENITATASYTLSRLLLSRFGPDAILNLNPNPNSDSGPRFASGFAQLEGDTVSPGGPSWVGGGIASTSFGKDEGFICLVVEWPEDRRLEGWASGGGPAVTRRSERSRNLVIWVKMDRRAAAHNDEEWSQNPDYRSPPRLFVHPSLFPPFVPRPLQALVHPHQPFELSLVILQPVLDLRDGDRRPDDNSSSMASTDLDLQPLYGNITTSTRESSASTASNHGSGDASGNDTPVYPPILRQGEIIFLNFYPTATSTGLKRHGRKYRLSLLEPVSQGILTPATRVILSTTPYVPPDQRERDALEEGMNGDIHADEYEDEDADGVGVSESSYSRTHLSLADFDPDAFLSSALSLTLPRPTISSPSEGEQKDENSTESEYGHGSDPVDLDMGHPYSQSSSTSGSLTPRPGPGHGGLIPSSPPAVIEELLSTNELDLEELEAERGARYTPLRQSGVGLVEGEARAGARLDDTRNKEVCWMSVGGLGRAGIFEGDWVLLRVSGGNDPGKGSRQPGRLVKALAWERLDEMDDDLPSNPILLPPSLYRSLIPPSSTSQARPSIIVQPTSFGTRAPTVPVARTITLARIATAEGTDKRFERSWLKSLKHYFATPEPKQTSKGFYENGKGEDREAKDRRLVRGGDIISIPVWPGTPLPADQSASTTEDEEDDSDDDDDGQEDDLNDQDRTRAKATGVAYFIVTSLSYDPLVPLEEDFRSSVSSKARAGELGCWADVGATGSTKMILTGVEKQRVPERAGDLVWHKIEPSPPPFSSQSASKLRNLLRSTFAQTSLVYALQLSILIKGVRGSGKRSLIRSIADELGYNIVDVECYDIVGDTSAVTAGTLLARLEKAKGCAPSLLVLHHIEALAKKTESTVMGRPPPIVKVIEEIMSSARIVRPIGGSGGDSSSSGEAEWPVVVMGTTVDGNALPNELAGCFKQEVEIKAPNEIERLSIIQHSLRDTPVAPDVDLQNIARQTAALNAGDIAALLYRARDFSLKRISSLNISRMDVIQSAQLAGLSLSSTDLNEAISEARSAYSDSIGAPKIPNVSWDDVGGLKNVKKDILDTIQLPLERPELFGEGLKKRSGILLYGPPGTGKTLLAKAVATSCSLNFLSVKGPELLNMYIGESEANVRRLFQRARDASPCVIFMDELDSVAPKRGNQGDSAGVMDRIVSQLLAELDGMSSSTPSSGDGGGGGGGRGGGGGAAQVFVLGATNRPDLLDPALLRPGRFDKMIYLSVPDTNEAQLSVIKALTRKFQFALPPTPSLSERRTQSENDDANDLDLEFDHHLMGLVEKIPFNYTGADLYALCSDAMLNAMTRCANAIDERIAQLNADAEKSPIDIDADVSAGTDTADGNINSNSNSKVGDSDSVGGVKGEGKSKGKRTGPKEITPQYYLSKMATPEETQVRVTISDFEGALGRLKPSVSEDEMKGYEAVQREFRGFEIGHKDKDEDKKGLEARLDGDGDGDDDEYRPAGEDARQTVLSHGHGHGQAQAHSNGLNGVLIMDMNMGMGTGINDDVHHPPVTGLGPGPSGSGSGSGSGSTEKGQSEYEGKGKGKGRARARASASVSAVDEDELEDDDDQGVD
ncbi:hypothetical protein I317_05402 [Kwoniella heveanensis CBS 569]|nr:hypothetical protein I317_05402 [Kwoniella heveanensis CBS 569]